MRKQQPEMVKGLVSNPLPNSFTVTPVKGEYTRAIAETLQPAAGRRREGDLRREDGEPRPARRRA